jgi:acyl-CoA thioester hydrolase
VQFKPDACLDGIVNRSYSHTVTVQASDIDDLGHVNNVAYARLIEDIARAHANSVGLSMDVLREQGRLPVMLEHHLKYRRAGFLGDELTITTEILMMGGLRAKRHNQIKRGDEVLVDSQTDWVWVDVTSGRPKAIPQAALEAFGF